MALSAQQIDILKYVDDSTKIAINSYVRQTKESCNLRKEIPSEILQIILLFYHLAEHFDIHSHEIDILSDAKDVIQKGPYTNWRNLTFGAVSVPSMSEHIFIWTFEILANNPGGNGFAIGIVNTKDGHRTYS